MAGQTFDWAVLAVFAEAVLAADAGPVADIGCGPGRLTTHLDQLGVKAFGIDLSPEMIAIARRLYPHLDFEVGSMTELNLSDGELGGLMAWYSLIHIPPERHPAIFATFYRALAAGGHLLVAFQAGDDEPHHRTEAAGHSISLTFYRLGLERVLGQLTDAGFVLHAKLLREANPARDEKTPQGFLIVRKPD
jgi:SAM-dependent methyltransferase